MTDAAKRGDRLSAPRALEVVQRKTDRNDPEDVRVREAYRRVLARALTVREDLPRFDKSAMDGYAVRAEDLELAGPDHPVELPCTSVVAAGEEDDSSLRPGTTARIYTGAPIPDGADSVVIQENVRREGDTVTFTEPVPEGNNVRFRGEETKAGSTLLREGTLLNGGALGLAWSQGYRELPVYRPPRVVVLATGDELVSPDQDPAPGQIRDTNSPAIQRILQALDLPAESGRLPDDRAVMRDRLDGWLERCDLLFLAGGVSVGDRDLVRPVLEELDVEEVFWKVRQKPGKPLYFGRRKDTRILGLPGNPVSALVNLYVYGIPLVRTMLDYPPERRTLDDRTVELGSAVSTKAGRTEFLRARTEWNGTRAVAHPLGHQGSHMLTGLSRADGLLVVPEETERLEEGDPARLLLLPDSPVSRRSNPLGP